MEVYSVNISDVALADMESIYNYILKLRTRKTSRMP